MNGDPTARLKVAIVDEEFPFPANSGKRIRTLNLVQRLVADHDIYYVAHQNSDRDELDVAKKHFESIGITTVEVPRRVSPRSGLTFYGKLAANLFSSLPYSVSSHSSSAMRAQLKKLETEVAIDIWHCEWTPYAEMFRNFKANPLVISAHNVESLIWQRYTETESNPVKRWYIRQQWKKFQRFERWAFDRAGQTIAVSDEDAQLAEQEFGAKNVEVVQNGVDIDRYKPDGVQRRAKEMIFLGSLDWRPNLDGIQHFLKTAFPEIIQAEPESVFSIVGRNPPSWLIQLAQQHPNIELHGNVPDVIPYLSNAAIMVVPLRIGGGSRLKIIEAAANELPVVSTRVGAEGLRFRAGHDYFVAETIELMTEPVLYALRNREASCLAAKNAREIVERDYDWDALANAQARIWRSATCNPN